MTAPPSSYKASKEAFVSDTTGSTLTHINLVSSVALASIALHAALRSRIKWATRQRFVVDVLLLVLPPLLAVTRWADAPGTLSILLLVPAVLLALLPPHESGTPLPSNSFRREHERDDDEESEPGVAPHATAALRPLPAVSTWRAHMMLMTVLCILAVDFPVFPRALAKCETYGVSLMDLGVGSFVFSQGFVSALPILKNPGYLSAPALPKAARATFKCLPILVLGLVRVVLVKGTDYPEHETEYGRHWNFFITLGLLPPLQILLHPLIARMSVSGLGFLVALAHQLTLSFFGLMEYVLNAPRNNIISANKEGIVSLPGYLAIHLLGLALGTLLLPPSPSYLRRQQRAYDAASRGPKPVLGAHREDGKAAIELCAYAIMWWSLTLGTSYMDVGGGFSRRMANLPYVLWIAAFNSSFLLGYLVVDMYFHPTSSDRIAHPASRPASPSLRRSRPDASVDRTSAPALLEAINKNSLSLFLLANVATGLVNLSVETMYASDGRAMWVLGTYAFGWSAVAWAVRGRRLIKL